VRGCAAASPRLIEAGFETLVNAGYAPEMAYFECVHESSSSSTHLRGRHRQHALFRFQYCRVRRFHRGRAIVNEQDAALK